MVIETTHRLKWFPEASAGRSGLSGETSQEKVISRTPSRSQQARDGPSAATHPGAGLDSNKGVGVS